MRAKLFMLVLLVAFATALTVLVSPAAAYPGPHHRVFPTTSAGHDSGARGGSGPEDAGDARRFELSVGATGLDIRPRSRAGEGADRDPVGGDGTRVDRARLKDRCGCID